MNARSLSPFLVSFLLVGAWLPAPRLAAEDVPSAVNFASCRSLPVDASGVYVGTPHNPLVSVNSEIAATPPISVATVAPIHPKYSLTRDDLTATLTRQLANHFDASGDLSVEVLSNWKQPPDSFEPLTATIVEYPNQLSSNFVVRVHVESSSAEQPDFTVGIRAQLWRSAWATRAPVSRGDVFVPTALDVRRVDCLRDRDALFTGTATQNLSFSRGLPAAYLLSWRDVVKRALVRRGEVVEVVAVDGNLSVSMKGVAMQNGGMGDLVSIRNPESQREITAMVVAENRAEVRF